MKVQVISDIHLEFASYELKNAGADVLILCGDVILASSLENSDSDTRRLQYEQFFEECSKNFNHVIYLAGNHEFYYGMWNNTLSILKTLCSKFKNVYFLENDTVEIDGITFVGTTLWTDCNKQDVATMMLLPNYMNDFNKIYNEDEKRLLSSEDVVHRFKESVLFINNVVKTVKTPIVVCTHHAPSFKSVHPSYRHDHVMNGGYCSDLEEFITDNQNIKLWCHGHIHNYTDYYINKTRVLCNPRGYISYSVIEQTEYKHDLIVEV